MSSYYQSSGYRMGRPASFSSLFNPSSYAWSAFQPGGYGGGLGLPRTGGYIRPGAFSSLLTPEMTPWRTSTPANPSTQATPPTSAPPGTSQGGNTIPQIGGLDISNDPILQKMVALTNQQISDATAEATRQRTQLAIGYGDPALVKQLGLKEKTGTQAKNNPFSTLAELARGYTRRNVFDINRPLSDQANLFYSSERGRQLALSGEQNLRDRSQAGNLVQQRIAEISQQLLQAKLSAQMALLQAEQDAYNRALQQAYFQAGVNG